MSDSDTQAEGASAVKRVVVRSARGDSSDPPGTRQPAAILMNNDQRKRMQAAHALWEVKAVLQYWHPHNPTALRLAKSIENAVDLLHPHVVDTE